MGKVIRKKINPLMIETQEIVAEAHMKSTELIRLSRVKYEGNDLTFVDVRVFSRGYNNEGEDIYHPTRRGVQLKEADFLKLLRSYLEIAENGPLMSVAKVH